MLPACDIVVIGGGAAGLATAAFAARRQPGARITVLDGARTLGAKILVSGGGRCNVTNVDVSERDFNGGSPGAIRRVLGALPVSDTVAWFRDMGVGLHEEHGGKIFPDSNRSRDVLDALLREVRERGARIQPSHRVTHVTTAGMGFNVETSSGRLTARFVVIATGGLSLPKTGSDGAGYELARRLGHSLVPTTPALVPLVLDEARPGGLQGVTHDVSVAFHPGSGRIRRFSGSMLWTHFGVSGPAILDASRHWLRARLEGTPGSLSVAFPPFLTFERAEAWLRERVADRPRALASTALESVLPRRLAEALTAASGSGAPLTLSGLPRAARRGLAHAMSEWPLPVRDSRGYAHAEATAGGVGLDEIDPSTMASRRCPGLFLVGEVLDVDGRLGGFNFQWAWSSAAAAARGLTA